MDADAGRLVEVETVAREVFELTKQVWLSTQRRQSDGAFEISESEFLALDLLQSNGPLTVGGLQRSVHVLPAQMSRIIRSLETRYDEPLVSCTINADDRRKIDVQITQRGEEAAEQFRHRKIQQTISGLQVLSDDDLHQLLRIVRLACNQAGR